MDDLQSVNGNLLALSRKTKAQSIIKPPYVVGDVLWVRETFYEYDDRETGVYYWYKADVPPDAQQPPKWKPAIHMPKSAARLFLKVTGVRVERLQDISEKDARAEGIRACFLHKEHGGEWSESSGPPFWGISDTHSTRKKAFAELWDSLNAERGYGWDTNPWTWVIDFEVLKDTAKDG